MPRTFSFSLRLLIALIWGISWFLHASTVQAQAQNGDTEVGDEDQSWEELFIQSDIEVSRWFGAAADGLDVFLAGKRLTRERNKTRVVVENTTTSSEGHGVANGTSLNVNLQLPNTEQYWQLKFTSYDDRQESRGVENNYLRQTVRERQYGATIGFFRKLGNVRMAFQPRIVFKSYPQISQSLSFESVGRLYKMEVNPKMEFYADPSKGAGVFTGLNFNFYLTKVFSLTLINEGDYQDKIHLFTVNNGFSLGHSLDRKSALAYSLIFTSLNQPSYHLEAYDASVSWTYIIYKNVLDFQIVPHVNFAKNYRFKGAAGVILNLSVYF